MSKHTPGEWVIDWNVSRLDIFSSDAATLVASIRRSAMSASIDETARANARLIAAAPAMLEALEALANEYGPHTGRMAVNAPRRAMWFNARAAIKVAKGEA